MSKFIVISIPTFNRCEKLNRTLNIFFSEIKKSTYKDDIGVFVSNNGSTDKTLEVLNSQSHKYKMSNIDFNFRSEKNNIGMDLNYLNMIEMPVAEYIWFFSDDDILFENKLDGLIASIRRFRPSVCNYSFLQKPYKQNSHRYTDFDEMIYTDFVAYPSVVSTKLSSIIVTTKYLNNFNFEYDDIIGSCWAYIPYVFSTLMEDNNLLIYPYIVAGADKDCLNIRYDPLVLTNLHALIKRVYASYGKQSDFLKSNFKNPKTILTDMRFLILILKGKAVLGANIQKTLKKRLFKEFFNYRNYLNLSFYSSSIKILLILLFYKRK